MPLQRIPTLCVFWDFKKTAIRNIHIAGTVEGPPLAHTEAKTAEVEDPISDVPVSWGPPVVEIQIKNFICDRVRTHNPLFYLRHQDVDVVVLPT